ncbi:MAG: CocE/NonD family hydrolase [Planctomycetota bacterium]
MLRFTSRLLLAFSLLTCSLCQSGIAQTEETRAEYIRSHYTKFEYKIPMRDGTKLFTAVYIPNDADQSKQYPVIMMRTPYSVGPYGIDKYRNSLGPNAAFEKSGYIFAFQDVRGCYMSDGEFVNMRPHNADKKGQEFDESTDTFDTIEWLSEKLSMDNGKFGQWGISYPGFYTAAGAIDSHPNLKCISPQAPIGDWFWDDMHRNGAFNVQLAVTFFSSFGQKREGPTTQRGDRLDFGTDDAYQFFLDLGSLKNVNEKYFQGEIDFWNQTAAHPNYDYFWQSRNIIPHLKNMHCAVLVVGGWFDTEDLYGPLRIYESIEKNNPQIDNTLVMGPWYHGGWNRSPGESLGDASFDWPTAEWYRTEIEFPFFEYHLKGIEKEATAEAIVFETGANRWRNFAAWPPPNQKEMNLVLDAGGKLLVDEGQSVLPAADPEAKDTFLSDPAKPVPYTTEISSRWARDYMTEDQRFAARRPDVLVYRSDILEEDITIAGPLTADLWFSTTGTSADVVVKIIDEFPGRPVSGTDEDFQSGRQQLVRGQVMRTRFRKNFASPEPLVANQPENIQFELHDVLHTFKRGHRIMVQIQGSWFPFVDRNPQTYVPNIFEAGPEDFQQAFHSIYRGGEMRSKLRAKTVGN